MPHLCSAGFAAVRYRVLQDGDVGHYSSFIVRLWVDSPEGFRWGVIQHVGTQEEHKFNSVADMVEFISKHSAPNELSIPFSLDATAPMRQPLTSRPPEDSDSVPRTATNSNNPGGELPLDK